jgi:hypothetical protein
VRAWGASGQGLQGGWAGARQWLRPLQLASPRKQGAQLFAKQPRTFSSNQWFWKLEWNHTDAGGLQQRRPRGPRPVAVAVAAAAAAAAAAASACARCQRAAGRGAACAGARRPRRRRGPDRCGHPSAHAPPPLAARPPTPSPAPPRRRQQSREKGWRSLYAGLKPSVVATAASQGIYFYTYSLLRGWAVVSRAGRGGGAQPGAGGRSQALGAPVSDSGSRPLPRAPIMATAPLAPARDGPPAARPRPPRPLAPPRLRRSRPPRRSAASAAARRAARAASCRRTRRPTRTARRSASARRCSSRRLRAA